MSEINLLINTRSCTHARHGTYLGAAYVEKETFTWEKGKTLKHEGLVILCLRRFRWTQPYSYKQENLLLP